MRVIWAILAALWASPALAADGAWVAFYRDGNISAAFERSSVSGDSVNVLSVKPKSLHNELVISWEIKTQVHKFDCGKSTYRLVTKKFYDQSGKLTGDDTAVVTAMSDAFKNPWYPVDTDTLRKAYALVCTKSEPAPAKPFDSFGAAIGWMAN